MDADEILVMDHGKIIERGTHTELMARDQVYARMYTMQFSEEDTPPRVAAQA